MNNLHKAKFHQYTLELKKKENVIEDYEVLFDENIVGELQLTIHPEYVFIRHIRIYDSYKRQGHATSIVNMLKHIYKIPIQLAITMHSNSAILFWENYFKNQNVKKIRGNIYCIE